MIDQILVNDTWTDGIPTVDGQIFRVKIPVGDSFGYEQKYHSTATTSAIRKITKRAFMQRFTQAERIAIRASSDDIVIDIHEDLKATNSVELDLADTVIALAHLVSVAILTSDRPAEILADGTQGEI